MRVDSPPQLRARDGNLYLSMRSSDADRATSGRSGETWRRSIARRIRNYSPVERGALTRAFRRPVGHAEAFDGRHTVWTQSDLTLRLRRAVPIVRNIASNASVPGERRAI